MTNEYINMIILLLEKLCELEDYEWDNIGDSNI